MLAEYATLRELRESSIRLGEGRVTSFLTMLSAAILGFGVLYQNGSPVAGPNLVTLTIIAALAILGCNIFVRVVEREIAIVQYTRGMNRVRRYFVTRHPDIRDFVSLPITDDEPRFGGWARSHHAERRASGLSGAVGIINCVLFSLLVTIGLAELTGLTTLQLLAAGSATFVITAVLETSYYVYRTGLHNTNHKAKFPAPRPRVTRT